MTFRVLGARVVVKPLEKVTESAGGILLPDSYIPEAEVCGRVTQVGQLEHTDIKVGDLVFFSPQAGFEAKVGDESLLVIPEDQILAVVDEE